MDKGLKDTIARLIIDRQRVQYRPDHHHEQPQQQQQHAIRL